MMKPLIPALLAASIALTGIIGCARKGATSPPRNVKSYVEAVWAYQAGDRARAIAALEDATKKNPDLIMARGLLGDLYREAGQLDKALEHYKVLTRLDPYTPDSHFRLGLTYHLLQRLQDAAGSYLRALKLDPHDANSNMNLGLVYLSLGQFEDALRYTERATRYDPTNPIGFHNLGVALEAMGDYARAETAYRRALDLDPTRTETLMNLGLNLIAQGKARDAVAIMRRVLEQEDTSEIRKRYADALARAGEYDESLREYQKAVELDAKNYQAMNEIGWILITQYRAGLELDEQKREQAVQIWQKSLALNRNQPRITSAIKDFGAEQPLFNQ